MATSLEKRMSSASQSGAATDPFAEFLEETRPQLTAFQVPAVNDSGLEDGYTFDVKPSQFPTLDDALLTPPRVTDLKAVVEKEQKIAASEEKSAERVRAKSKTIPLKKPRKSKKKDVDEDAIPSMRNGRQRSLHKHQTPMDRAKLQLLQVCVLEMCLEWFETAV